MSEILKNLSAHITGKLGAAVLSSSISYGELTIWAEPAEIGTVLRFLRDDPDCRFVCFIDICESISIAKALAQVQCSTVRYCVVRYGVVLCGLVWWGCSLWSVQLDLCCATLH